ncbi:hypothetical protein [Endozoicomonas sp. SESOKO1]|nr:hypothetical protein [Endozoicomonas sp. SESOKO1]
MLSESKMAEAIRSHRCRTITSGMLMFFRIRQEQGSQESDSQNYLC